MENIEIIYIVIGALVVLNIIVIKLALKYGTLPPDDLDLYNEDCDHIYYDRKLIKHKKEIKK